MLSIIILTYNSHQLIKTCLDSIYDSRIPTPFTVIVLDNDSQDQTQTKDIIRAYGQPNLTFIANPENLGFAKAVNQGIRYAKENFQANYFLLFNPDATLKEDCLYLLLQEASTNNTLGLLSPVILQPEDQSTWFKHGYIDWFKMRTAHSEISVPHSFGKISPTPYLTGCCLLIKRKVIDALGGLDERFFLYYEDADFSVRTQQAGFAIKTVEKSIYYHTESQSSTSKIKNYHLSKSGLLFFHKHLPIYLKPHFWTIYWLRLIYHKYLSGKKEIYEALRDFRA